MIRLRKNIFPIGVVPVNIKRGASCLNSLPALSDFISQYCDFVCIIYAYVCFLCALLICFIVPLCLIVPLFNLSVNLFAHMCFISLTYIYHYVV